MKKTRVVQTLLASLLVLTVAACSKVTEEPVAVEPQAVKSSLPSHATIKAALVEVVGTENGGFGLPMWVTVTKRDGTVHAVAFSGKTVDEQWLGSRAISAVKANTANAFSLPTLALSTANLYTATQPGGSLSGLNLTNPVDTDVIYGGKMRDYGTTKDYMVGKRPGGIKVFGGGLALYNASGELIGALGVSGDSSCADHNIAWKLRDRLKLDNVPGGVSKTGDDNIVYDTSSGWNHPECSDLATTIGNGLPLKANFPIMSQE